MKTCNECGETKPLDAFELLNKDRGWRRRICRDCKRRYFQKWAADSVVHMREYADKYYREHRPGIIAKAMQWQRDNPKQRRTNALSYYYRLQFEAIEAYGGFRCACCGETEPMFLTIDHINDDGKAHRARIQSTGGAKLYKSLRDEGWPKGFRVLCMNCNQGRYRNGGACPHEEGVTTIPKGSSPKVRAKRAAPVKG